MAASATITLDLTPPDLAISLDGGATISTDFDIAVAITVGASDVSQMKIYGDVDDAFATAEYRALEANAPWISFAAAKTVRVSAGDGVKVIRVKVRDDVNNATGEVNASITVNTAIPIISISSSPAPTKISKQAGKDTTTLTFTTDIALDQWQVRLVTAANATVADGTLIPETGGSDTQGGAVAAGGSQVVSIKGVDLEAAGASGGPAAAGTTHRVKVFGRSAANGQWSAGAT